MLLLITAEETELEIVYPNRQPILSVFDKNASGDRCHLAGWVPDLTRNKLWVISDSVLSLYNEESPKMRRPFGVFWWENSHVWKPFITEATFLVRDSGEKFYILKLFMDKLANDPDARGDPKLFAWHLILYSCCNEDKYERDPNWKKAAEYIRIIPKGLVAIFGPADGATWWPQYISSKTEKWDKLATQYFNILSKSQHPWIRGLCEPFQWLFVFAFFISPLLPSTAKIK